MNQNKQKLIITMGPQCKGFRDMECFLQVIKLLSKRTVEMI